MNEYLCYKEQHCKCKGWEKGLDFLTYNLKNKLKFCPFCGKELQSKILPIKVNFNKFILK